MECHACCISKIVTAVAEADIDRNMGRCQSKRLKEACKKLQEAMQNVCLTCVDETNDNNPSNHGQVFYSLDSGHCQSAAGRSSSSRSDSNEVISRADWISSHASCDSSYYQDGSFRPYAAGSDLEHAFARAKGNAIANETPKDGKDDFFDFANKENSNPFQDEFSITSLPSPVEAILIREINNFASLPSMHQMLICCLLAGLNISDFARMDWLPKEIRRLMKPRSKDMEVITAQTAHSIYQNICKKLPYLTVLARATKKRSKERVEMQNAAIKNYQASNSKLVGYLNSPQSMAKIGKPRTNPHASQEPLSQSPVNKPQRKRKTHKEQQPAKFVQVTIF